MPVSVSIQNINAQNNGAIVVTGKLIFSGNYPTGGDTVDFTAAVADPALVGGAGPFIESSLPPMNFDAWSQTGLLADAYLPVIGTTQKNNKVKVVTAFGTELGAGAYPAAVIADNVGFQASFFKLI